MNTPPRLFIAPCALFCALLTACSTCEPQRVPVSVPCAQPAVERPFMPTEWLQPDVTLDGFVQAAAAEIERREAYEAKLRAALEACK